MKQQNFKIFWDWFLSCLFIVVIFIESPIVLISLFLNETGVVKLAWLEDENIMLPLVIVTGFITLLFCFLLLFDKGEQNTVSKDEIGNNTDD